MPESLIHSRIKEALLLANNDRHDAVKLLIVAATRDPALLLEMTKPHLKAIATGLIDHQMRNNKSGTAEHDADNLQRAVIDDIMKTSALNLPHDKRKMRDIPPPKSTERQASTMRKLAAAFTRKKKD